MLPNQGSRILRAIVPVTIYRILEVIIKLSYISTVPFVVVYMAGADILSSITSSIEGVGQF